MPMRSQAVSLLEKNLDIRIVYQKILFVFRYISKKCRRHSARYLHTKIFFNR